MNYIIIKMKRNNKKYVLKISLKIWLLLKIIKSNKLFKKKVSDFEIFVLIVCIIYFYNKWIYKNSYSRLVSLGIFVNIVPGINYLI